jgi:diaminohydroxyphosphoribosylaminopyrimidine deaminase / 5-amino-6-(5-phosphoribosylamino)uracil reductase
MPATTTEELLMKRALELASLGKGKVSPNPMVGCVIERNGLIIGEGWHQAWGGPHAEVNAINAVEDKSLLAEATLYVTLEPCSHYGKTPPCADLLVAHKVKKVVICNTDSNPLVSGRGIKKLTDAGIEVVTGVLAAEGRELNKRFFTFIEKKRPYIVLKWAQTNNGFIARENFDSKWISSPLSRKIVHKWRTEEDAIMVGRQTAAYDDPQLNVRSWSGRNPVRIVIDRNLSLPDTLHLFDGQQPTLCYNLIKNEELPNLYYIKIEPGAHIIDDVIQDLYTRNIGSVLVEGGSFLLNALIDRQLYDELRIFVGPVHFPAGIEAPKVYLQQHTFTTLFEDRLYIIRNT